MCCSQAFEEAIDKGKEFEAFGPETLTLRNGPRLRDRLVSHALLRETYLEGPFHFVVSTGLNEFLQREELTCFHRNVYDLLAPGGVFFSSATQKERRSETIMRLPVQNSNLRPAR